LLLQAQFLAYNSPKTVWRPGSARPDPLEELERSPDQLAAIGGLLLRGGEGKGGERTGGEGRGGKGKGMEGKGREGKAGERREGEGRGRDGKKTPHECGLATGLQRSSFANCTFS